MKSSEVLELAKTRLWDGNGKWPGPAERQYHTICSAINSITSTAWRAGDNESVNKGESIKKLIHARLSPMCSLRHWLEGIARVPFADLTPQAVQAHRLAWMNLLIEEYKAKGD